MYLNEMCQANIQWLQVTLWYDKGQAIIEIVIFIPAVTTHS